MFADITMHVSAVTILSLMLSLKQIDAYPNDPHHPYPTVPGPPGHRYHVPSPLDGW